MEWVKWNQDKARIAAAELQGERNAREFIAKLPNATAADKEQLAQTKRRQTQIKQYSASLRQHQSKHERIAANAPVERLNFNNQYVVPGSLSQLSQAQTKTKPQAILPQSSTSHNPFSLSLPGTQQGEEAGQYWANLYVQGEQQGGLGGIAKQVVAAPLGMLSSLWTKDTALQTTLTLGTAGLGAAAGAGRLGAASVPVVRGLQIGGAFQSGTSIGQGISGKDMWTGEDLSPLDRGFHLTLGAVGGAFDLGGSGLRLGSLGKSFPTMTNALEGISAPQVMRTGGRLGVSTEGGSIKLGDAPEGVPKGIGAVDPIVKVGEPQEGGTVLTPKAKAKTDEIAAKTEEGKLETNAPKMKKAQKLSKTSRRDYLNKKFDRTGNIDLDINIRGRKELATNFFLSKGVPLEKINSFFTGIDFTQVLEIQALGSGKQLWQYQTPGAPQGSWYSITPSVSPSELGIADLGVNRATKTVEPKLLNQYTTEQPVNVLRSTSAPVEDFWSVSGQTFSTEGGAIQLFSNEKQKFIQIPQPEK